MQDLLQNSDFAAYSSINEHKINNDKMHSSTKAYSKATRKEWL